MNRFFTCHVRAIGMWVWPALTSVWLCACGGGGSDSGSYSLGGSISGLTQAGLVLSNGSSTLAVASGSTSFSFDGGQSGSYSVKVSSQPSGQTCVVNQAEGTLSAQVSSVQVVCRNYHVYVGHASSADLVDLVAASDGSLSASGAARWTSAYTPSSLLASPDGRSLWLGFSDDNSVVHLKVGDSGSVSSAAETLLAATFSLGMALGTDGQSLYVPNYGASSVSQFSVGSAGVLSAMNPASVTAGLTPSAVAVSRGGGFAYAANPSGDSLSLYSVGSTGALTALAAGSFSTSSQGSKPFGLAANPVYDQLYVTLRDSAKLLVMRIEPASGALTVTGSQSTGTAPRAVAVSPNGAYVYVLNQTGNSLSQFLVSGSSLTPMATRTLSTGTKPMALAISPDGSTLYVANSGDDTIGVWHIGAGGELQAVATVASGGRGPVALAVR